ncbi:hypothetical protein QT381_13225 [Galbitalea sp. SE-J8]|uniref:hypothetical protein n=1 Tax=Galbitalea sp. SE-J8 TaxID=3054952 RepID=UPI00259C91A6|nr:hypothetical protein [Galbitalea sp. SE-J8]MDM4763970.1 hypothetical protein [Galbitalea sp. SE-J8]
MPDDATLQAITAALRDAEVQMGDDTPSEETVTTADWKAIATRFGSDPAQYDPTTGVYVLHATGEFTGEGARHPAGTPAPKGTSLTVVLDASGLNRLVLRLSSDDDDYRELGPTQSLT